MLNHQADTDQSAREAEQQKWDAYYDSLPLHEEDPATRQFNDEFVDRIAALLQPGSQVLEAGCGAGWQSLALARSGRFAVSVLDFSPKALDYSRRVFEREQLSANFIEGDIRDPGDPAFDLVFNAGVIEHYTFDQQAALLRCMARRSRRYVLVLVPNALCYWYWLWRIHKAAAADWPFGKEVPLADLSAVFTAAGLHFCGQVFLGQSWAEAFIQGLPGMDAALSEQILRIHRSPVVPPAQRSYLVAALGSLSTEDQPHGWESAPAREDMGSAETRAIIADTLAAAIGAEGRWAAERLKLDQKFELAVETAQRTAEETVQEVRKLADAERRKWEAALQAEREKGELSLRAEQERGEQSRQASETLRVRTMKGVQDFQARFDQQLAIYRSERAWRIMLAIRKAYTLLVRRLRGGIPSFFGWAVSSAMGGNPELESYEPELPAIANFVPAELFAAPAAPRRSPRAPRTDRHYDVVVLPIFDYEFRFQRPQQIAVQLARTGHRVFWISPSRYLPPTSAEAYETIQLGENVWEVRLRVAPFDLYRGALDPSQTAALLDGLGRLYRDLDLNASCVILQFPFWRQIGLGLRQAFGARVVYDCMDDWQNWPTEPLPGAFSLAEENKLVGESDVLVVTSRELRDRHAAAHIDSILIPNAADFETFRNPPPNSLLAGLTRPIVGYYGAIADWFDLELMTEVARLRPQYSFVLIGQVHLPDISQLKALPNTHLLGEKPYRELPGYLRQFDVCTLPFRMNRLTKAVDPVKVYEYLSQGKPVVSVPLPELDPLAELLYFAAGPQEFAARLDRALAESDPAMTQKRIAFASENTWGDRVAILDGAIRARFPLISLLVVTYNTREFLRPFFDSLRRNTSYPSYEVVVVDNHSSDGSAEDLNRYAKADPRIRVFLPEQNLGFAGGNNLAAQMAKGEYLVLLNPDTILTAGWLEKLLRPLEADPTVGMSAPVSNFSGNETKINTEYRSLDEMEEFAARRAQAHRGETLEIQVVPLFAGLLRRSVWDEVGGLDEEFKVGTFEDDDFSLRLRNAGYRIVTAEDCFIHHFGNGSFAKLESETMLRIFDQNKKRFESKWNIAWRPHQTRPGVRPISADNRVAVAEFCQEEEGAGGP